MFFEWFLYVLLICGEPQDMKLVHGRTGQEIKVKSIQDIPNYVAPGQLIKRVDMDTEDWMVCT